jgi:hypothetical protein
MQKPMIWSNGNDVSEKISKWCQNRGEKIYLNETQIEMSGEDDEGSLPHRASVSLSAAIAKLESKLGRGKSDRGKIYAHLPGFEDDEELEVVPGRSPPEDAYTKALVKLHAAIYALRDKGHRQAATALELLVHKKWLTYVAPPLFSRPEGDLPQLTLALNL